MVVVGGGGISSGGDSSSTAGSSGGGSSSNYGGGIRWQQWSSGGGGGSSSNSSDSSGVCVCVKDKYIPQPNFLFQEYGKVRFEAYFKYKTSLLGTSDDFPGPNNITELLKSL